MIQLNSLVIEYDQAASPSNQVAMRQLTDKKVLREKIPSKIQAVSQMLRECRDMIPQIAEQTT